VAEDYVDHTGVPDTYRRLIVLSRVAFPGLMLTIEDEIVEGDRRHRRALLRTGGGRRL
jgi:hypothetical protein